VPECCRTAAPICGIDLYDFGTSLISNSFGQRFPVTNSRSPAAS
jgi:hypothetical protein